MKPETTFVFYSCKNKKGLRDATGAFIPEALEFQKQHGIPDNNMFAINCVDQNVKLRKGNVLSLIHSVGNRIPISALAFFGHGWPDGIQFGFNRKNIISLVILLKRTCNNDLKIVLYSCLNAENDTRDNERINIGPATDGGFADVLRDEMESAGFSGGWIDAHKKKGRACYNPFVCRFIIDADINDNCGGHWLVQPGSMFWTQWKRAMENSNLRFHFPFLTEEKIKSAIAAY